MRELSRGVDLPSTFHATSEALQRLLPHDWLAITWQGSDDETPHLYASLSGQPGWLATTTALDAAGPRLKEWALPAVPRITGEANETAAAREPGWPVPAAIKGLATVPMPMDGGGNRKSRQRKRGALLIGRSDTDPIGTGQIPLLEACASQLCILLEKADWLKRFRDTNEQLRARVRELEQAADEKRRLESVADISVPLPRDDVPRWLAVDPPGVAAIELVERAAETELAVLLEGESGTGKELLARTLHLQSRRADGPFVPVNVATLTRELAHSELFGHLPGSFTGARGKRSGLAVEANHGTLFLDEVGDMPIEVQPTLLRFLETGMVRPVGADKSEPVDVRLVCATNRDLLADVIAGRFREDLYHRIAGVVVQVPPLRDRPSDLRLLANHFLNEDSGGRYQELPVDWWPAVRAYHWPGNVREIKNAMRAVASLSRGPKPELRFLPGILRHQLDGGHTPARIDRHFDGWTLAEVEREMIRQALDATAGHKGQAATRLGITARSLYDRIRKFELS